MKYILSNSNLNVCIDGNGSLQSIEMLKDHEKIDFSGDYCMIESDLEKWYSIYNAPQNVIHSNTEVTFQYCTELCDYKIVYIIKENRGYLERFFEVIPKIACTISKIKVSSEFKKHPREAIEYKTFWNCPTTSFLRFRSCGIFSGFAHPFFKTESEKNCTELSFEPAMHLRSQEEYRTEANFWGMYTLSGYTVAQQVPKTSIHYNGSDQSRYRNPCGHIPLDRNEIRAFKQYADDYLNPSTREFKVIFYNFFCPLPEVPSNDEDENLYYHYIDVFSEMGGEIITFDPLVRNRTPLPQNDSYWELAPAGSRAERIFNYAKSKGLKIGVYMGSAPDNFKYCNSPLNEFASPQEKQEWKKVGISGEISRENCIADDNFADWFFHVQKNTIEKYGITLWDWDPGPGNGFFCYSTQHGHIPGKGSYKGFRNAMNIVERLKQTVPGIYIHGFHGTKEYGLWGFKGFDQHEAYWEECPYEEATVYPDLSPDRLTTSGMRFQSWWCQNFRFMPASMNHSLAHRMCQSCTSPREHLYLFDHLGWKYGIISAIAAGASITVPVIPYEPNDVYGDYIHFFKKWTQWAKDHFEYNKNTIAFGNQVVCGTVDGFSKIILDHGFLFLGNAAPIPSKIVIPLNEEIGLSEKGRYVLKQIYPEEFFVLDEETKNGTFAYGETITIIVPQYEILIVEIINSNKQSPCLFGINGEAELKNGVLRINKSEMETGYTAECLYTNPTKTFISRIEVNGQQIPLWEDNNGLRFSVIYGDEIPARYLYEWRDNKNNVVSCPNTRTIDSSTVETSVFVSEKIKTILEQAKPKKHKLIENCVSTLKGNGQLSNYAWALPYRLFLVVPFSDASRTGEIKISINGKMFEHTHFTINHYDQEVSVIDYLDVTDIVNYNAENTISLQLSNVPVNHFLGAYLYYPSCGKTNIVNKALPSPMPISECPLYEIVDLKPCTAMQGRKVNIESAWIERGLIEEYSCFTVYASVNLPPEELEGVYISAQISIDNLKNSLRSDESMEYDMQRHVWKKTLTVGSRQALIIDGEAIHLWAVTKDRYVSQDCQVKVNWHLA